MKQITVKDILTNAFTLGLKNFLPLLLTVILYVLTIWIPYLNVGTTIAVATLPSQIAKGTPIKPTSIFDAKYRRFMGDYFLVLVFKNAVVGIGYLFAIIPGIVLQYSYMFSALLVVDKGVNASEALSQSNKMLDGYKAKVFLAQLVLFLPFLLVVIPVVGQILVVIYSILLAPISLSVSGYLYGVLSESTEEVPVIE